MDAIADTAGQTATLQDRNPVDAIIAVKRYMRAHGLCPADAAFDVHVFHSPVGCTVKFRLSVVRCACRKTDRTCVAVC